MPAPKKVHGTSATSSANVRTFVRRPTINVNGVNLPITIDARANLKRPLSVKVLSKAEWTAMGRRELARTDLDYLPVPVGTRGSREAA